MRRSFVLSAACHGALLVALIFCVKVEPPQEVAAVFACAGEQPERIDPHEPDPAEPPLEAVREELPDLLDDLPSMPVDDFETIESPPVPRAMPDTRRLAVRLKRPLIQRPPPVARPAHRPIQVRGPSRAPARLGTAAPILYPRRARRRGLEGVVELRILVDRAGSVARVVILRSSGHPLLDDAAKSGVTGWRFTPALRLGDPVPAWIRRTVRFQLAAP